MALDPEIIRNIVSQTMTAILNDRMPSIVDEVSDRLRVVEAQGSQSGSQSQQQDVTQDGPSGSIPLGELKDTPGKNMTEV